MTSHFAAYILQPTRRSSKTLADNILLSILLNIHLQSHNTKPSLSICYIGRYFNRISPTAILEISIRENSMKHKINKLVSHSGNEEKKS